MRATWKLCSHGVLMSYAIRSVQRCMKLNTRPAMVWVVIKPVVPTLGYVMWQRGYANKMLSFAFIQFQLKSKVGNPDMWEVGLYMLYVQLWTKTSCFSSYRLKKRFKTQILHQLLSIRQSSYPQSSPIHRIHFTRLSSYPQSPLIHRIHFTQLSSYPQSPLIHRIHFTRLSSYPQYPLIHRIHFIQQFSYPQSPLMGPCILLSVSRSIRISQWCYSHRQ